MRYDDDDAQLDDEHDLDEDQGEDLDDDGDSLTQEVTHLLAEKCQVHVDDPSQDPEEFLHQLAEALDNFPGWQNVEDEDESDQEDLSADDYEDDEEDDREERRGAIADVVGNVLNSRRHQRAAMSSGRPRLKARLANPKKSKPVVRRMSAHRGKQAAKEQLKASGFFPDQRTTAARLSHGRTSTGPVSKAKAKSKAAEILANCPFVRK